MDNLSPFPVLERLFPVFCFFLGRWFCPGTSRPVETLVLIYTPGLYYFGFFSGDTPAPVQARQPAAAEALFTIIIALGLTD